MRPKPFCLALVRVSLIVGLTLSICAAAKASGREKAHFVFQGTPAKNPTGGLVLDTAGNVYGVANGGEGCGTQGCGTVFRFAPKAGGGWSYSVLYSFAGAPDGLGPLGSLVIDKTGNVYGVTGGGGLYRRGTVFELTPSSSGQWAENVLYSFGSSPNDADYPQAGLIFDSDGNLYGTTYEGGAYGFGTVFELSPSDEGNWTESVLYSFAGAPNDGSNPMGGVVLDDSGNLYGTTQRGGVGTVAAGTVFELSPASGGGWVEAVLYTFQASDDGAFPWAGVIFDSSGSLYGTTQEGGGLCGQTGCGTVFKLSSSGGVWTESIIHRFSQKDGIGPEAPVAFDSAGNLFGTTFEGGSGGMGEIFRLKPTSDGRWMESGSFGFTGSDGAYPTAGAGLIFDPAGNLYGATFWGGNATGQDGDGVVFVGKP
jgi:uncharacterized repeat protein (TIGR03803 family)